MRAVSSMYEKAERKHTRPEITHDRTAEGPARGSTEPVRTKTPDPMVPPTPMHRRSRKDSRSASESSTAVGGGEGSWEEGALEVMR